MPLTDTMTMSKKLLSLAGVALAVLAAACGESPTAATPLAPSGSPSRANNPSYVVSQSTVGDTTVTVFVVGTNANGATFDIGSTGKIDFPYGTGSICDPATSSYGPGTWDAPCTAASTPVRITAKSWINAQGKVATDFQPAMRFVQGLRKPVGLALRDATLAPSTRIDYCSPSGCVNEALTDPSLVTRFDAPNGFAYRAIKHFSGYTITAE